MVQQWRVQAGTSAPGCVVPSADPPHLEALFGLTRHLRIAPRTSLSTTARFAEALRKRHSSPRSATSTGSTAAAVRAVAAPHRREPAIDAARARALRREVELRPAAGAPSRRRRSTSLLASQPGSRATRCVVMRHLLGYRRRIARMLDATRHGQLSAEAWSRRDEGAAVKDALDRIAVPGEEVARERARRVVLEAYAARGPLPRQRRAPLLAIGARRWRPRSSPSPAHRGRQSSIVCASSSGSSVQPALSRCPEAGRLLVEAADGLWVVERTGRSACFPGPGRELVAVRTFIVAVRTNELVAIEADGDIVDAARARRPLASLGGHCNDTKIAYVDRSGIRVVAGDGTATACWRLPSEVLWRGGRARLRPCLRVAERDEGAGSRTRRVSWRRTTDWIRNSTRTWSGRATADACSSSTAEGSLVFTARGRIGRPNPSRRPAGSQTHFLPGTQRVSSLMFGGETRWPTSRRSRDLRRHRRLRRDHRRRTATDSSSSGARQTSGSSSARRPLAIRGMSDISGHFRASP